MSLSGERVSDIGIIEGRFIRHQLRVYGENLSRDSQRVQNRNGFSSPIWSRTRVNVSENRLEYSLPKVQRFVDMKYRNSKAFGKKRKKSYPIYNRPVMGNKKHLVKMLSFGFTEEVKNQFRNLEAETNIKNI